MLRFTVRRLLLLGPTLLGLSLVIFVLLRLAPGDPVVLVTGPYVTQEVYERTYRQLGLDRPLYVQYGVFLSSVLRGDLGRSLKSRQPVVQALQQRLPRTLLLALAALVIGYGIAFPAGIYGGMRPNTGYDLAATVLALAGICIPSFWMGLLLMELFGVRLGVLPVMGSDSLRHLVLPAITLGVGVAALPTRILKASMEEVLKSDYVRTARSKGLANRVVILKHALRNASISVVTLLGLQIGWLAAGAVVVEMVFDWRGIGSLLVSSVIGRDYPVVQGVLIVIGVFVVLGNFIADLLYSVLDPRIRYG
jgi:peptide/nickel transport system permease protein